MTEPETIEDAVVQLLSEQFGVSREEITPETRLLEDLNRDDLDHCEIVMEVEDKWNLSIPDEDADLWKTVGDIVTYVKSHTAKQ